MAQWRSLARTCLGPVLSLALGLSSLPALAQDGRPRAVVVLDGSGSMWGQIDGTAKIEMARGGLISLVDSLEGRADLGLIGYGHRRKADCRDIEIAFPPGQIDAAAAKAWLAKFGPRGKTPMASALEAAGAALAADGKGGHIVIVTDGADNCRQDPCGIASTLAAADPALRMHVVVLGKTDEDMRKTRCIAETGQGLIEEISDAADIVPALDRIVMAITGSSLISPQSTTAAGPPGLRLSLRLGPDGPELTDDLAWVVTQEGETVYSGSTARPSLDLAPGDYLVRVSTGGLQAEREVTVSPNGPTAVALGLDAGSVRITLIAGAGADDLTEAYYSIYRADPQTGAELATIAVGRGSPPPLLLASGSYRAVFEQGLARIERALNVEAGRTLATDVAFDIGRLQLSARATAQGPIVEDVFFTVSEDDPEAPGGRREVTTSAAAEPAFTLRAGLYHVRVERGAAVAEAEAAVRGGETSVEEILVPSGRVALQSRIAGSPETIATLVSYAVERVEPEAAEVARLNGPVATVTLPEGRYRVISQYGAGNARAMKEFTIAAGGEETVIVEHEAGVVAFAIDGAAKSRLLEWTVKQDDGVRVWASADPKPQVPLSAGSYRVEVQLGTRIAAERFNVAPGETKTVLVRPE